ncbi:MAG: GIY-YIG nuclease family protein [Enterococcus sp.]|nr:GIY-YIG nuclease family protein [Enterococcus sp.]
MQYGKTIEMFLVDGDASKRVTAELSNWNGKAIKIPRTMVSDCDRVDLKGVGVYFLFCENEGRDALYIGEAENVLDRLQQNLRDYKAGKVPYYWSTAVAFIGRDLNKAFIRYLEYRFCEEAVFCERAELLTKNTYKNTVLKESQIASMEEFIDNAKVLLSALGYRALTPIPKAEDKTLYFYCNLRGANAKGFVSDGGFTVLKGSKVSEDTVKSFSRYGCYYSLRCKLEEGGTILDGKFQVDFEFDSPSAASSVVAGRLSNGNTDWKTEKGEKLKDT